MATLLELYTIEANSRLPLDVAETAEVTQARQLRQRIRVAVAKAANVILASAAALPTEPDARTVELERIAWARETSRNPDGATDVLLRLALAAPSNTSRTVAQILGIADAGIESAVVELIPRLAKGLHPDR